MGFIERDFRGFMKFDNNVSGLVVLKFVKIVKIEMLINSFTGRSMGDFVVKYYFSGFIDVRRVFGLLNEFLYDFIQTLNDLIFIFFNV